MTWNLVNSTDLDALPVPQQFFAMSDAYLDAAVRLCNVLARSTRSTTYQRGAVVLYLAHHSLELFLKGMISTQEPDESFAHDLEHLSNRYRALFPGKTFAINMPFTAVSHVAGPEARALVQRHIRSRTERLRYPIDKTGKLWGGVHGFEASSFKRSLASLGDSYVRIRGAIAA